MKGIYLPGDPRREQIQLRLLQAAFWLGWAFAAGALGFTLGAAYAAGCGL